MATRSVSASAVAATTRREGRMDETLARRRLTRGSLRVAQLDEHAAEAFRMEERDARSVRARPRGLVDEPHTRFAAARERRLEVGHVEAHVMEPRAAVGEEARDGVI